MARDLTYLVYKKGGEWETYFQAANIHDAMRLARQLVGSRKGTFCVIRCFNNGTTGKEDSLKD